MFIGDKSHSLIRDLAQGRGEVPNSAGRLSCRECPSRPRSWRVL